MESALPWEHSSVLTNMVPPFAQRMEKKGEKCFKCRRNADGFGGHLCNDCAVDVMFAR